AHAHQEQVRIEVDVHRFAPLCDGQIGDLAARRENAGVQHQHIDAAECKDGPSYGDSHALLVGDVALQPQEIRARVKRLDLRVEVEADDGRTAREERGHG